MIAALAFLRGLPWRYILPALAAGLLYVTGVGNGVQKERAMWVSKEAKRLLAQSQADTAQAVADAQALQARIKEDNQFVARAATEQAQLQTNFSTIQGVRRATQTQFRLYADRADADFGPGGHAVANGPAGLAGDAVVLAAGAGAVGAACPVAAPAACPATPGAADTGPVLSLGAVWLWNAALVGQGADTGACHIDAATGRASAACADSSGLTLDAAWDNQAANAQSCALDRANHQRLIDFIHQREASLAPSPLLGAPNGSTD